MVIIKACTAAKSKWYRLTPTDSEDFDNQVDRWAKFWVLGVLGSFLGVFGWCLAFSAQFLGWVGNARATP